MPGRVNSRTKTSPVRQIDLKTGKTRNVIFGIFSSLITIKLLQII